MLDPLKIRPFHDAVLVKEDGPEQTSEGGILLGRGQVEPDPWLSGRVVRIGEGKPNKFGLRHPPGYSPDPENPESHRPNGYEPGDRVCYRRSDGMELPGGYLLLTEGQVVPALLPDGYLRLTRPYAD